ncbi:3-hydroxyacyl-CoA dehydrogenase NAD-binding domain-containing protein [Stackebrandtia nassauensis]|uniref:3-hydroxyacyl-CoA dehydrogenase NAD-binding protein n=1 Tax=Stackebrandtia nassauensis (strain DSM 44728 / CIP 108903 / NRRL B-16338 / NBRC 102104 / LLR-40K-21) TaxID=446470 RepID=D3PYW2_STANL|nr:3-hydroxyacyl-CoA dehydrogenase NAD-binding domain-containing protein [Stackebrandtia nassauensis]ADD43545.1 3-hydroxyacyl-CoA dehydrogenase NAD-binding protein [Stackebrandtia nassauensis DSM 44728]
MTEAITYAKDDAGIVTLTIDVPGEAANPMTTEAIAALNAAVTRLESERDSVTGVIVTSAKPVFSAGGDLRRLVQADQSQVETVLSEMDDYKRPLRRLEKLGKPVVAAINGSAMGGGFELALACHRRIVADDPKLRVGLPEVTFGLLPGAGGVVRTVRMLGLMAALPLLTEGKRLGPADALAAGLVHEVVPAASLLDKAREWIASGPEAVQPWDVKGYKLPGGGPNDPGAGQLLAAAPAMLVNKTHGAYPAPEKILAVAVEGALVDVDTAFAIETRYFTELACGQVSTNMIGALWFDLNDINAGRSRPDAPKRKVAKVGVLGAGMMGAGIAYVSAYAGIDVVLKDVSAEAADKGKAFSAATLDKRVGAGRMTPERRDEILSRITATGDDADLAGCDLIIEAVFEKRALKEQVLAAAETQATGDAVIASNTSTLPITGLAKAVPQAERFVGLHFFSPVHKMPLVEIIRGEATSDETLARAFDYVRQINKTPIVVNDSRGFYTSRSFATYALEGLAMVAEGVPAALVENVARQAGMAVGPLAVSDEVSLSLMWGINQQTIADYAAAGVEAPVHPAMSLVDTFVNELNRPGKAAGAGLYEYPAEGKKRLWPELATRYGRDSGVSAADVRDRLLFVQSLEAVRCLEENVVTSAADANIGSIFGWGFGAWSGGVLRFINQYGLDEFIARAEYLAERYGERFAVPQLLRDHAAKGEDF